MSSDQLDIMRRTGRIDLYFFAKSILGFRDLSPVLHGDVCSFITDDTTRRKLLMIPRGHFKSSIGTVAYPLWRIVNNPNIRILIAGSTHENAASFLQLTRLILEGQKRCMLPVLYPEILPTATSKKIAWNNQALCVPRTEAYPVATIEAVGAGAATAGRHHDIIIKDDIVSEKTARSESEMRTIIEWHKTSDALFDVPSQGVDIVIGTRWGFDDFYAYLMKEDRRYTMFLRKALDRDGNPVFPERFSVEDLAELRRTMGEYHFSCQYLNDPTESGRQLLNVKDLRHFCYEPGSTEIIRTEKGKRVDLMLCDRVMLVDPAKSKLKTDCYSAIVVVAVDHDGDIFVLEAWRGRVDANKLIDQLFTFHARYRIRVCAIESVGYQEVLVGMTDNVSKVKGKPFCRCVGIHPGQKDKDARIEGMGVYAKMGQVYLRSDENMICQLKDFMSEWVGFGLTKNKDILDAFAYGPRVWLKPQSPKDRAHGALVNSFYGPMDKGHLVTRARR